MSSHTHKLNLFRFFVFLKHICKVTTESVAFEKKIDDDDDMHPKEPAKVSSTATNGSNGSRGNNNNTTTTTKNMATKNTGFVPTPDDSARNYPVYQPNCNDRIRTASAELMQDALKGPITIPNGHISGQTLSTGKDNAANEHIVYRLVLTGGKCSVETLLYILIDSCLGNFPSFFLSLLSFIQVPAVAKPPARPACRHSSRILAGR